MLGASWLPSPQNAIIESRLTAPCAGLAWGGGREGEISFETLCHSHRSSGKTCLPCRKTEINYCLSDMISPTHYHASRTRARQLTRLGFSRRRRGSSTSQARV